MKRNKLQKPDLQINLLLKCFVVSSDIRQQLLKVNKKSGFYYDEIKKPDEIESEKNGKTLLDTLGKKDANIF